MEKWLEFFFFFFFLLKHHLRPNHHQESWKGLLNGFIHGFRNQTCSNNSAHTVRKRERNNRDSVGSLQDPFSQSFFGSTNSTDELLAARFDILPSMALKYTRPSLQSILSKLEECVCHITSYTVTFKVKWTRATQILQIIKASNTTWLIGDISVRSYTMNTNPPWLWTLACD